MNHESDLSPAEDDFAARLAELHQALLDQDPGTPQAREKAGGDPQLDEVAGVLRLIERVRRREAETPRSRSDPQSTAPDSPAEMSGTDHTSAGDLEPAGAPPGELPALPPRIGRFHVVRQLGAGGYGIVLLGYDPLLKRPVAIKVPRPEVLMTRDLRDRFTREAEAAAALHHANVVPVYETGSEGPICYIAAAYINGPSLADWLRRRADPVPPRQAAKILETLAGAVEHAHQRGVLHRDLKPANILIEEGEKPLPSSGREPGKSNGGSLDPATLRITDFGLAKWIESTGPRTRTGAIVGTPAYMSPEQAEGGLVDVGPETDIYTLGVMLYELLVGRPPFAEGGLWETLRAVRQKEPIPPRRLRPDVPRDLEAICLKCLEKSARRRYRSATELAADLDRFLRGEAVRARRPGSLERAARWCRRNPLLAALFTTVMVLLSVLAAQAQLGMRRLTREVQRKEAAERRAGHLRREADIARQDAHHQLLESLLAQARMTRASGRSGQRDETLSLLERGARLSHELGTASERALGIRNELLAVLGVIDFRRRTDFTFETDARTPLAYAVDQRLVAIPRPSQGDVLVRASDGSGHTTTIGDFDNLNLILGARFSADGSKLAIYYLRRGQGMWLRVWDLARSESLLETPIDNGSQSADTVRLGSHLDPTGSRAALPSRDHSGRWSIRVVEIREAATAPTRIQTGIVPELVRFHPHRNELAVVSRKGLELWDLDDRRRLDRSSKGFRGFSEMPRDACWSPNGSLLAVAAGDVHLWSRRNGSWLTHWDSGGERPATIRFGPGGDLLATSSDSGTMRVWAPLQGRLLWQGEGELAGFSADGSRLAFTNRRGQAGNWKIVRSASRAVLDPHLHAAPDTATLLAPAATGEVAEICTFHAGRLAVCRSGSMLCFWDTQRKQLLGQVKGVIGLAGDAGGHSLALMTRDGLSLWDVVTETREERHVIRFAGPRRVALGEKPEHAKQGWRILRGGATGEVLLGTFDRRSKTVLARLDCAGGRMRIVRDDLPPASIWSAAASPDGQFLAVALRTPPELRIYRRDDRSC